MVTLVSENPKIWNIHVRLPQNPLKNLNAYVICTDAGNLVIDTGFNRDECREDLWGGIEELGLDLSRTALFVTHLHSDHCGLAGDFAQRGCPIYMGEEEHRYIMESDAADAWHRLEALFYSEGMPPGTLSNQADENQARKYAPAPYTVTTVKDHEVIRLGDLEITCLHTPGHTPGIMTLYLAREQVYFSSDHVLFDITPNIAIWHGIPHSLADYMDSLRAVRDLPIRMTLPAHRQVHEDVYTRIDEILHHHDERLEEIYRTVKERQDEPRLTEPGLTEPGLTEPRPTEPGPTEPRPTLTTPGTPSAPAVTPNAAPARAPGERGGSTAVTPDAAPAHALGEKDGAPAADCTPKCASVCAVACPWDGLSGIDAYRIASHITWSAGGRAWETFPPTQIWFAMSETLSHLYYLVDRGKLLRIEHDGAFSYRTP
ncbi:MAG: MBL fold metallo-hydrolase [Lachnospiraceae bacterium]|jgi:glyoxylase-like metal-dependent hydrolase (beta-lactamase superfamily II)|nr:MBL fold metallo-hydrolase [Lachnospiraceae bacterium]